MKASVIATVYNQADYLVQMIESVLCQKTDFEFEFIIANDGSTDNSSEIIGNYAQKDSRIVFINNKENIGFIRNYALCLETSQGKYVAQLGGDDFWIDENKLQEQVDFLEKNPDYGMVHTQYDVLYMYNKFLQSRYQKNVMNKSYKIQGNVFYKIATLNTINAITVCFVNEIVKKSGYLENLKNFKYHVEDLPLWLTISKDYKVGYLDKSTICYRQRRQSLSHFEDLNEYHEFHKKSRELSMSFLTTDEQNLQEIKEGLIQQDCISYTYLYFKKGDFKKFRKYYLQLKQKDFARRVMYWVLLFRLNRLF